MGYVARIPSSVTELHDNMQKLFENKSHISSARVNESTRHLEFDLDWSANKFGGEAGKDFFLPIKVGKLREAKVLLDRLMTGDHGPTRSEAQELFDMLDPQNK